MYTGIITVMAKDGALLRDVPLYRQSIAVGSSFPPTQELELPIMLTYRRGLRFRFTIRWMSLRWILRSCSRRKISFEDATRIATRLRAPIIIICGSRKIYDVFLHQIGLVIKLDSKVAMLGMRHTRLRTSSSHLPTCMLLCLRIQICSSMKLYTLVWLGPMRLDDALARHT